MVEPTQDLEATLDPADEEEEALGQEEPVDGYLFHKMINIPPNSTLLVAVPERLPATLELGIWNHDEDNQSLVEQVGVLLTPTQAQDFFTAFGTALAGTSVLDQAIQKAAERFRVGTISPVIRTGAVTQHPIRQDVTSAELTAEAEDAEQALRVAGGGMRLPRNAIVAPGTNVDPFAASWPATKKS